MGSIEKHYGSRAQPNKYLHFSILIRECITTEYIGTWILESSTAILLELQESALESVP